MFRNNIDKTALVGIDADNLFTIYGDSFYGDVSGVSTLRALLGHRMKEGDSLTLCVNQCRTRVEDFAGTTNAEIIDYIFNSESHDLICVVNFMSSESDSSKFFDAIEHISEYYPDWKRVIKLTEFFAKSNMKIVAFANSNSRATYVFTERFDLRKWHAAQAAIPRIIPWYFSGDYALTEDEKNSLLRPLLQSLVEGDNPDTYLQIIQKIADEKYDFRKARLTRLLGDYETQKLNRKIRERERQKSQIENEIRQYLDTLSSRREMIFDINAEILGYTSMLNSSKPGELLAYFVSNKNLELIEARNGAIKFLVRGHLDYFPDTTEDVIANRDSYIYSRSEEVFEPDDMEMLLRAVFVDRTIKIRSCACIALDTDRFKIDTDECRNYRFDQNNDYNDRMPNVHIDQFGCFGGNHDCVEDLLREGQLLEAIEQCCAAASNLDLNDYSVGSWFIDHLCGTGYDDNYHRNVNAFELPDGRVVNPATAIEYLKSAREEG